MLMSCFFQAVRAPHPFLLALERGAAVLDEVVGRDAHLVPHRHEDAVFDDEAVGARRDRPVVRANDLRAAGPLLAYFAVVVRDLFFLGCLPLDLHILSTLPLGHRVLPLQRPDRPRRHHGPGVRGLVLVELLGVFADEAVDELNGPVHAARERVRPRYVEPLRLRVGRRRRFGHHGVAAVALFALIDLLRRRADGHRGRRHARRLRRAAASAAGLCRGSPRTLAVGTTTPTAGLADG
ncbi:hypothetical protein PG994_003572 [Apiospora phragmitis]|uniref:Uncharacterized protein n=1 Tax=Apiospora phragmitis TaxID=2905665 RepID=A0ABR1VYI7_9PEZI